jgi:hypothetical protein
MHLVAALTRRLLHGDDVQIARRTQARLEAERQRADFSQRLAFLEAARLGGGDDDRLRLGRVVDLEEHWHWAGLPRSAVEEGRFLITGSSGSGKTRQVAALLWQLLLRGATVLVLDWKGELASIVAEVLVPAAVARGQTGLIGQVRLIRPFDAQRIPMLRLTAPMGASLDVHALTLSDAISDAAGADMGARMHRIILPLATLAVEIGAPLPTITVWLRNPMRLARDARRSRDPLVRAYVERELPRESQSSLDALRARLDSVFHLEDVRLALSTPACIQPAECLESGVTIFDFGAPPAGAESAMRFFSGPLLRLLARSILSRPITPQTQPAYVAFEEFQEGLTPREAASFIRLLSLARFRRCPLVFAHQEVQQVNAIDRGLLRSMRTNVTAEFIFQCSLTDARELSEGLAQRRRGESLHAARARMVEELVRLPRRSFYFWWKGQPFGPQLLRSPRFDLDQLAAEAEGVPPELREQLRQGWSSVDRGELRAQLAAEEHRAQGRAGPLVRPRGGGERQDPLG